MPSSLPITVVPQYKETSPAIPFTPMWMHKEDGEVLGGIRSCAPCPAVMVIKDDGHARIDQQHQYFLRASNYNMTLENVFLLLDGGLAFANKTGFSGLDNPGKKDYFFNRTNYLELPKYDKVRTTARSIMTGEEAYSLFVAIVQTFTAILKRELRPSMLATSLTGMNVLNVKTLDSRVPPPLKPNRLYPIDISEVNPDDYLYTPETHPWMFMVANIVNAKGEVVQFPRGALYPWTKDNSPRSFVPYTANHSYGPFQVPLTRLQRVFTVPSPYRFID